MSDQINKKPSLRKRLESRIKRLRNELFQAPDEEEIIVKRRPKPLGRPKQPTAALNKQEPAADQPPQPPPEPFEPPTSDSAAPQPAAQQEIEDEPSELYDQPSTAEPLPQSNSQEEQEEDEDAERKPETPPKDKDQKEKDDDKDKDKDKDKNKDKDKDKGENNSKTNKNDSPQDQRLNNGEPSNLAGDDSLNKAGEGKAAQKEKEKEPPNEKGKGMDRLNKALNIARQGPKEYAKNEAKKAVKKAAVELAKKAAAQAMEALAAATSEIWVPLLLIVLGLILLGALFIFLTSGSVPNFYGKSMAEHLDPNSPTDTAVANTVIERAGYSSMHVQGTGEWSYPLPQKGKVTCQFGCISRTHKKPHSGMDIAVPQGTPVLAVDSGTVKKTGYSGLWGYHVIIDHNNGYKTLYAHMLKGSIAVSAGSSVVKGQKIGRVDSSGKSTGNHLHITAWKDGELINPATKF